MNGDEMRDEYDFSGGKRGVLYGKIEKKNIHDYHGISPGTKSFAVCVKTFDSASLIPRKIYQVTFLEHGLVALVDEQGGDEVYPAELFLPLSLPAEIENALAEAAA